MITDKYFPPKKIISFLETLPDYININKIGESVLGRPIHLIKIGEGFTKLLLWSQMHGNETTTTKALTDFVSWVLLKTNTDLLNHFSIYIIPQLNPDGAQLYTRNNANNIDLNRDAVNCSEPETQCLLDIYRKIEPDFCFNLHDQRTIYSAGRLGKTSSVSFLAPSSNQNREITNAREKSMQLIVSLFKHLSIPKNVGRYDDVYNPNCMGDYFIGRNTPTILFEAGHTPGDYSREITRKYIFLSLCESLRCISNSKYLKNLTEDYFAIPENKKDFVDIMVSGANIKIDKKTYLNQCIAIQYIEILEKDKVVLRPSYYASGERLDYNAHKYIDFSESNKIIDFKINKIIKKTIFNDLLSVKL